MGAEESEVFGGGVEEGGVEEGGVEEEAFKKLKEEAAAGGELGSGTTTGRVAGCGSSLVVPVVVVDVMKEKPDEEFDESGEGSTYSDSFLVWVSLGPCG